ncbi:ArnT family glycosyltransferase [Granulicella arctica]|uniref:Glycosyltransferase RgtA/B/C/D-like domain-containing protein n=1 Tax=Granulicella arctica TaxID=940613 RepID=A0A7Y9TIS5_9BACT|nr:hypothetical protein [Granulicella arctica]NYF81340.1 hypothetical protein [Granulicella arctica]
MTSRARRTGRRSSAPAPAEIVANADPNVVRPATRAETFPIALFAVLLSFLALIICYLRGYLLLYGDAVAHLGIARRILDSRNPGWAQLGGVWLPLPHLLMVPFVQKMMWWQNGLAGAWPSLLFYVAGVAGFYRLARRVVVPRWAFAATVFYGLNPNLLYLATTAMTEPLFLALFIWLTLLTVECVAAIRSGAHAAVARRLVGLGLLIVAAVYTRYDGWIAGAVVWCVLTWELARHRSIWARVRPAFVVFTLLAVAAPLGWLAYNQHFYHDPLDFMRGPYSASAIEKKTSPPGSKHYRGWHNPGWALLFYMRTAQVDAAAWEIGFALMVAALAGLVVAIRRRMQLAATLLWMPLPFYIYSIAYGSVPIFIPQLYPHSFYNSRYGMEMLPALTLFCFVAIAAFEDRIRASKPLVAKLMEPAAFLLIVANAIAMVYFVPLVLKEGIVNATTRVPFEAVVARELQSFPVGSPILMYTSDHIGAIQQAGIPLKQMLSEGDYDSFHQALSAPANYAAYVVAIAGDPVSAAVASHPANLTELTVLCSTGQPCARVYQSNVYKVFSLGLRP